MTLRLHFRDKDAIEGLAYDDDGTFKTVYNGNFTLVHDLLAEAEALDAEDESTRWAEMYVPQDADDDRAPLFGNVITASDRREATAEEKVLYVEQQFKRLPVVPTLNMTGD